MKVLGLVGSPRKGGNSETMVKAALNGAEKAGAQVKLVNITDLDISGCNACMYCRTNNGCAIKDDMQTIYQEIDSSEAVVIGFPVYMRSMNAQTKTVVERLYPYLNADSTSKVNKKSVLAITQGLADKNAFTKNLEFAKDVLTILGFPVNKVIIEGNGNVPGIHSKNEELIRELERAGAELVS